MSRTHKPTLQLLSLNVNGLREPAKRRQLFHQILEGLLGHCCIAGDSPQ